jgi:hypothetical protein
MDANKDILYVLVQSLSSEPAQGTVLYHLLQAYQCIHGSNNSLTDRIIERMELGRKRYGHGIRLNDDTRQWGTKKNSWMEMCEEEILDGIIYTIADHLRRTN